MIDDTPLDVRLRMAAIAHIGALVLRHGEMIPRATLMAGFGFAGERIPLISAQRGIYIPGFLRKNHLPEIPISFTTTPPKAGKPRPYEDSWSGNGDLLQYKYFGTDPGHRDNVGMRMAISAATPLIYFFGVKEGYYRADWPVFIIADNPLKLEFTVSVTKSASEPAGQLYSSETEFTREATLRLAKNRPYQRTFRQRVLLAYRQACCVCQLKHDELLDAAHIIPDSDPRGEPWVHNGLALCKIHHAAFDAQIMAIKPESFIIEIRDDVLREHDGPMLTHGLQALHQRVRAVVPTDAQLQPKKEFLAERYQEFLRRAG